MITSYKRSKYPVTTDYLNNQTKSFLGKKCLAGVDSFKIDVDGSVRRCAGVKGDYGNLYEGTFRRDTHPGPCPRKKVLALSWCKNQIVEKA